MTFLQSRNRLDEDGKTEAADKSSTADGDKAPYQIPYLTIWYAAVHTVFKTWFEHESTLIEDKKRQSTLGLDEHSEFDSELRSKYSKRRNLRIKREWKSWKLFPAFTIAIQEKAVLKDLCCLLLLLHYQQCHEHCITRFKVLLQLQFDQSNEPFLHLIGRVAWQTITTTIELNLEKNGEERNVVERRQKWNETSIIMHWRQAWMESICAEKNHCTKRRRPDWSQSYWQNL